jgi:hypothetical protein
MKSIRIDIPMNVAPSGFPRWRSRWAEWVWAMMEGEVVVVGKEEEEEEEEDEDDEEEEDEEFVVSRRDVLRRKSWVMAIPMLAKLRLVRSQARKVRSVCGCGWLVLSSFVESWGLEFGVSFSLSFSLSLSLSLSLDIYGYLCVFESKVRKKKNNNIPNAK